MVAKSRASGASSQTTKQEANPALVDKATERSVRAGKAVRKNAVLAKDATIGGLAIVGAGVVIAGGIALAVTKGFFRGMRS